MTFLMMMLILCIILVFAIPIGGGIYEYNKATKQFEEEEKRAAKEKEKSLTGAEFEIVNIVLNEFLARENPDDFLTITHDTVCFSKARIELENLERLDYFIIKVTNEMVNIHVPGVYFTKTMRAHHQKLYKQKLQEIDEKLALFRERRARETLAEVKKMFGKK